MNRDIDQEVSDTMRFLCGFSGAITTISKNAINYWLKNYSTTVFVRGILRQVIFEMITPEMYTVKTREIN
jgi:hypothetical protein